MSRSSSLISTALKRCPFRNASTPTTLSESSSELKDEDPLDPDSDPARDKSGLSRIFLDAVRFGEVLAEDEGIGVATPGVASDNAQLSPLIFIDDDDDDVVSVRRFAELVGRDLGGAELAASERFAKLSVNTWATGTGEFGGIVTTEPEAIGDVDGTAASTPADEAQSIAQSTPATRTDGVQTAGKLGGTDFTIDFSKLPPVQSYTNLSPEEIVKLLVEDFGPLATSEDDEEILLAEVDAAYFQEVAILGVIHVTTHRISFHASLLSTRPDLLPEQQIIKKGAVTIHRPGLLRKQRVWMELSHDMITTFPSGSDQDRIKPIRSILLAIIREISPVDMRDPKVVRIVSAPSGGEVVNEVEFDTFESASDWRREMQGALFLYRHRRQQSLYNQSDNDLEGVRISVPLSRVEALTCKRFLGFASMITLEISRTSSSPDSDSDSESEASVDDADGRIIEFAMVQGCMASDHADKLVEMAKAREARATIPVSARAVIDFGSLSFVEQSHGCPANLEDETKTAISHAMSLGKDCNIWYIRASISRSICSTGYFAISSHYVGFWCKSFALRDTKYRFPLSRIIGAKPVYRYRIRTFGMELEIKAHHSVSFDFSTAEERDEVIRRLLEAIQVEPPAPKSSEVSSASGSTSGAPSMTHSRSNSQSSDIATPDSLPSLPSSYSTSSATGVLSPLHHTIDRARRRSVPTHILAHLPKVINIPHGTLPLISSKHFVCLTIGSRGDVQPYIALALGLKADGHTVTIVTHAEYKEWVEGWGIRHRTAGGDPGALMKLSVENKMFSPQFFRESLTNFRSWLDNLLEDAWEQCKDADVLIESPSAMAGVHIAEALEIPYFRSFTMPWTKSSQFPHPFLSPPAELPSFNSSSYILFDNVFWTATSGQINRWRRKVLNIGSTDMGHMAQSKIPFVYNFSPSVVPKPLDWGDAIQVSGYWFLDNPDLGWTPPASLLDWIAIARADAKPIVYIGFGSITVPNPPAVTRSIVKAVLKSDVRAIISKGWSSRMSKSDEVEVEMPPECYAIDKIPHDWLFPQIDAALHHGGAGTTGASLRAGIPTLIRPWFGDQFFWASRVHKLGAGLRVSSLRSSVLADALTRATSDRTMRERAAAVGDLIRSEDGVQTAIKFFYTYMARATRYRTNLD